MRILADNPRLRLLCILFACICFGCQKPAVQTATVKPPRLESIAAEPQARIMAAKEELFQRLSGRLMQVLQEQGPAAAIQVCSQEAPEIAKNVSQDHGLTIARTSLKLRNPRNAAPDWAKSIIDAGPPTEPQFFDLGQGHIGAMLPIKLQSTCLLCHGPKDMIMEEVKTELTKYYPQDQATGFQEGDLRGWFWIDCPPGHSEASNDSDPKETAMIHQPDIISGASFPIRT